MNLNNVPNRLIKEKSPYLLQHAYNPVNWYPWGEVAFSRAESEGKPIFLSIGYSTCHWCHVMERESFEDIEVAELLNSSFIAIKVDREERPDIDNIYMTYCQVMTGSGGWPLTILMTPDQKPFYSGSYFPKNSKFGMPGLMDLLSQIARLWKTDKDKLIDTGNQLQIEMLNINQGGETGRIDPAAVKSAVNMLKEHYEKKYGGFSHSPKFPSPHNLLLLMRYHHKTGDDETLDMVENTLMSMYQGGIFDHVGFGFARYSTDPKWLVPHFEKMLYDNALLALAYAEAYQLTKKELYKDISVKIFSYVLRDMRHEEGGFYSAEDADSEGEEGKFYLWTRAEIDEVLGEEDAGIFADVYDITVGGNFEGRNIPNLIRSNLESIEKDPQLKKRLEDMREKLFSVREKRVHPFKDDKILTSWNGLMIAALSYAGRVLNRIDYVDAAKKSAVFILGRLDREDGMLMARYRDGVVANQGLLDDYAFLAWGLMESYSATFDVFYLQKAIALTDRMIELFWDDEKGGFFLNGKGAEKLILRPKEFYDGAIPSGNSVAAMNLVRLARITGSARYEVYIEKLFEAAAFIAGKSPNALTHLIDAYMEYTSPYIEVTISGDKNDPAAKSMIDAYNSKYIAFSIIVLNEGGSEIAGVIPSLEGKKKIGDKATAYVCKNYTCSAPTDDPDEFIKLIVS
jgi:uncharacterized protein YyaL (SSP411 family)